jgi:O-antigen/teichoic acid export membrane protein
VQENAEQRPSRARPRAEIAWGGVDQGFSSATNLGLSIVAGRFLGAAGLGLIFLGFSAYLLALSVVRGFITEPFVVATSAMPRAERHAATQACMTLVVGVALTISGIMVALGLVVSDPLGKSLLVFAPWVAVALIQDQWRSVLFRDQRGKAAAFNDGVWALGMVAMLPFLWAWPNDYTVAATWGVGAAAAALYGWWQVGLRPSTPATALRWWKRELLRLGSWLGLENIIVTVGSQTTIIVLAIVLSASDLGGIRVVQVVFAPMTLVGEAFLFPGVPIMARALANSLADARRWAWRLGLVAVALVGIYLAVVVPFGAQLLTHVFGPQFAKFTSLVPPTAIGQLIGASAIGFAIFVRADRRVHAIVASRALNTGVTLLLAPLLAMRYGVLGAVWGLSLGPALGSSSIVVFGLLPTDIFQRSEPEALVEQVTSEPY